MSRWPKIIQPEVEKYGQYRIWKNGTEVLGYPPTWVHTHAEVNKIIEEGDF